MIQHIAMTIASIEATAPNASANFKRALSFILSQEGVFYEDVPGDAGGATEDGITWRDYNAWRTEHHLPVHDLRLMTPAEVVDVYRDHYLSPCHIDTSPFAVGLSMSDAAVNVGLPRAVEFLQHELGVTVDGNYGPQTFQAGQTYIAAHGATKLAMALIARRVAFYQQIGAPGKTDAKFLAGWMNRVAALKLAIV